MPPCSYIRAGRLSLTLRDSDSLMVAHVAAVRDQPENMADGLTIEAQALATWGRVKGLYEFAIEHGASWPAQIAAATMRQAGAA